MPKVSSVFDRLRAKFLAGADGDCTLKFSNNGRQVFQKKCQSVVLEEVEYFNAQRNFAEGQSKEFKIDITDFYVGCKISAKNFVDTALLAMLDGDVKLENPEKYSLADRFGIVRFRGYLGLPYDIVLTTPFQLTVSNREASLMHVRQMLEVGTDHMAELTVKHHIKMFGKADTNISFASKWEEVYKLFEILRGSKDHCSTKIIHFLSSEFAAGCSDAAAASHPAPIFKMAAFGNLSGGVAGNLVETLKLFEDYQCSYAMMYTHVDWILENGYGMLGCVGSHLAEISDGNAVSASVIPYLNSHDFDPGASLRDCFMQFRLLDTMQCIITRKLMSVLASGDIANSVHLLGFDKKNAVYDLSLNYLSQIAIRKEEVLKRMAALESEGATSQPGKKRRRTESAE